MTVIKFSFSVKEVSLVVIIAISNHLLISDVIAYDVGGFT